MLEANFDKTRLQDSQIHNIEMRWHMGSNKKITAYFNMDKKETGLRVVCGDEMRLRYMGDMQKPWSGVGHVIKVPDNFGDEVGIELKSNQGVPTSCNSNFVIDIVWKSTRCVGVSYFQI